MRVKNSKWRRWRWPALAVGVATVCLFVFASNRCLYFSHQRFPYVPQWTHQRTSVLERPLIVGHRGMGLPSTNSDASSENRLIGNTATAIENAITANVDWIEIDIQVSADKQLVVFHDHELDAKTTLKGTVDSKALLELTSCTVLVDPPEHILSLKDVLTRPEFHAEKRNWIFDVKVQGIADDLVAQLDRSSIPKNQIILFADHLVLKEYKDKGYRLGYTALFSKHRKMFLSHTDVFRRCKDVSCDLLVVPIIFVTPWLVSSAKEQGIDVWSYDSNDPRDLKYCAECGVKWIIVDTPKKAMSQFNSMSSTR